MVYTYVLTTSMILLLIGGYIMSSLFTSAIFHFRPVEESDFYNLAVGTIIDSIGFLLFWGIHDINKPRELRHRMEPTPMLFLPDGQGVLLA